ncbi:MAG TPA: hypothetical protein VF306_05425 [Pirellulales bacterium]
MHDNPYKSPAGGNRGAMRFRLGRVLLAAVALLLLITGPLVWQAVRERRARQRAAQALQGLGQALDQYQAREAAHHAAPIEATEPAKHD